MDGRELAVVIGLSTSWLVGFFAWVMHGSRDLDEEARLSDAERR